MTGIMVYDDTEKALEALADKLDTTVAEIVDYLCTNYSDNLEEDW